MFEAVLAHTTGGFYRRAEGVGGDTRDVRPHCDDCGRYYSSSTALKVHMQMHKGVYRYWCEYRGRGFAATNNLKGHLAKRTGVKASVSNYAYTLKDNMVKTHRDGAT